MTKMVTSKRQKWAHETQATEKSGETGDKDVDGNVTKMVT